jgi:16S rRNA (cytosine967-C5)-methyltransferase
LGKEIHYNILQAIVSGLEQIFLEHKYADKVIEKLLKSNSKWGSRDRKTIAESIYNIVRFKRLHQFIYDSSDKKTNQFWHFVASNFISKGVPLPAFKELQKVDIKYVLNQNNLAQELFEIKESYPDWMIELLSNEMGLQNAQRELLAMNQEASVVLRANLLKVSRDDLYMALKQKNIETIIYDSYPDALVLSNRQNVFQLDEFKNGLFEVQDAGSQLIAPFLNVKPGMRVIDACAGAGGKTLHLATQMQNKGKLLALDTEPWKLEELKKRAKRAGVFNVETKWIENSKTIKRLENKADRLLLDVPCSGLGVIKRNPDAKWKLSEDFIKNIKLTQQSIIGNYSSMLKKGGEMVYATCSLLPSENKNQVQHFLESNQHKFQLLDEKTMLPSNGFDGFYMARMIKINE